VDGQTENAMKIRAISTLLGLAAALAAGLVAAQQSGTVARLSGLEGNVLVSQADAMVAATPDQRVAPGTRVLTTAGAKAMVTYDNGCEVRLKDNERFTVRLGECAVLLKEVVAVGPAPGAIGGGVGTAAAGGTTVSTILGVAAAGGMGYGIYELYRRPSVSPN